MARRRGARPATVGDFGAGRGWYSAYLNKVEGLAAAPYDYGARPGTAVRPFDISRPLNGTVPVFDAVLCLEVGEHVPARFEDGIFDNIATHAHDAVVLSWAAPGQPGRSGPAVGGIGRAAFNRRVVGRFVGTARGRREEAVGGAGGEEKREGKQRK